MQLKQQAWPDAITAGEVLTAGRRLESPSQEFSASMGEDGDLVVHRTGDPAPLWTSRTAGQVGGHLAVRDDGDVSVCSDDGRPVWSAGTSGHPGAFVQLHDDGCLVVHDFYRAPLWTSTPPS